MMNRDGIRGLLVMICLGAVLVGWTALAEAKSKKNVVATVNGKRIKWSGRYLSFTQNNAGLIIVGTKVRGSKTIGIGCPILLSAQSYPVTYDTVCSGQYAQHGGKQYWFNTAPSETAPFSVTFDSFDGTVVTGHFGGTLPPLTGATTPVSVDGTFRGPVNQ